MSKILEDRKLVLACNLGKGEGGADIIKKMRYGNINLTATSEKMHEVAKAMGAVTVKLETVYKEERHSISQ